MLGYFVFSPVLGRDKEEIMERMSLQGSMSHPERNSGWVDVDAVGAVDEAQSLDHVSQVFSHSTSLAQVKMLWKDSLPKQEQALFNSLWQDCCSRNHVATWTQLRLAVPEQFLGF